MNVLLSHQDRQSADRLRGEIQAWDPAWVVDIGVSAAEVLALAASGDYQAILWELATPGSAGLLTVRQLRAAAPAAVLLVTAFPGVEALAAQTLSEGADAYLISRPNWLEELTAILAQVPALLRRRHEAARLQQQLRLLREQHEAFLDSVPQALLIVSLDGRLVGGNAAAARLTGRSRRQLVGQSLSALLLANTPTHALLAAGGDPESPLPEVSPGLLSVWRDENCVGAQVLLQEQEGRYRLATLEFRPVIAVPGSDLLVTLRAVGEREVALVAGTQETFGALWESTAFYLALVDDAERMVRVGAGVRQWLLEAGAAREEAGGETPGALITDLIDPIALPQIRAALESEQHFSGEVGLCLPTGGTRAGQLVVMPSGEQGATLWLATPLRETEQREQTMQVDRAVMALTEAVTSLEGVHEPRELPEHALEAVGQLQRYDAALCRLDLACDGDAHQVLESSRGFSAPHAEVIAQRLGALLRGDKLPRQTLIFNDLEEYCRRSGESTLQQALAAEGLLSAAWLPVSIGGEPVGFIFLAAHRAGAFPTCMQKVLDLFTAEVGRAAAAAALFYQTQMSASLAQQLLRISVALNSRGDLEDVLRRVAEAAVNISNGNCCWVEVLDEQGQQFVSTFRHCPDHNLAQNLYVEIHKVAWEAVEQQSPAQTAVEDPGGTRYRVVAVPLRVEGRVVGVMTLGHLESRRLGATALNALQVLATQAAAAVRNMQLLSLASERTQRMEAAAVQAREEETRARTVLQAAASVTETRDLHETLAQIARSAAMEIGFERVRVFLAEHQAGVLQGRVEAYSDGTTLDITSQNVPLRAGADLLSDVALSSAPYMMYSITGEDDGGNYEQLFMPLRWQGELIGIIAADNRASRKSITCQQTRLLRALATLAAVAVERARMDEVRHMLVSALSHELRRPLASIQAYNELLLDEDAGPINEEQRTYLRRVEESCQRLARMIEDLLDWSKLRAGRITVDRQQADLRETVQEVADELQPKARQAEVSLSVEADEMRPVDTDTALLEQVISNLVDNAIKFNRPGGTVAVRLHGEPEGAVIEVEDSGPGIPQEFHGRIFEEFERGPRELHGQAEGTGLGLSIAARLTEYLGGSLQLDSQVGRGSRFSVRLPYAQP
ncbi:MAG TPA: ATP-binding protein [Armatimonadota bacterium]|jgi:signal transduction histidine kinase/PAS domain-containing protein